VRRHIRPATVHLLDIPGHASLLHPLPPPLPPLPAAHTQTTLLPTPSHKSTYVHAVDVRRALALPSASSTAAAAAAGRGRRRIVVSVVAHDFLGVLYFV